MKKYIKYVVVICLTGLIFHELGSVLSANYDGNRAMEGMYHMEKNTADVVFYGSSHVYCGINTASLWSQYGIAGYNYAGTMQPFWNSYYNMVETLKYQSPQVMVLDLYSALIEDEYYNSTNVIKNASSMKFSWNKIENIWNSVPHQEFLSYILSYPLIHGNYRDLQKGNYVESANSIGGEWFKGYMPSFELTQYDSCPVVDPEIQRKEPSEKNKNYLDKMVALADEHQINLAFIVVPYRGISEEDEALYCWIEDYAKENNILFWDGNRNLEEMNFDPGTDYAEDSHLNHSGACKFTSYLGAWLTENFELENHYGDVKYDSWQKYSNCWEAYHQGRDLAQISDVETYLERVSAYKEYTLMIAFDDQYKENPYLALLESIIGADNYDYHNSGAFVIEDGRLIYQTPDIPDYLWYMETESMDISLCRKNGGEMMLCVNDSIENDTLNDVTILIYDKRLDAIIDIAAFNHNGALIR